MKKLSVLRFVNSPVPSNSYIVIDIMSHECIVVDPGSPGSAKLIDYIVNNSLIPRYILLTHSDFDHTWGIKDIKDSYTNVKVMASRETGRLLAVPQNYFNALYFDNLDYFSFESIDIVADDVESLVWYDHTIHFVSTPGHTSCSNVIFVDDIMFSGDTILKDTRPFIQKKHGGDKEQFKKSVSSILKSVEKEQIVYPGHGEPFKFGEVYEYYSEYILQ